MTETPKRSPFFMPAKRGTCSRILITPGKTASLGPAACFRRFRPIRPFAAAERTAHSGCCTHMPHPNTAPHKRKAPRLTTGGAPPANNCLTDDYPGSLFGGRSRCFRCGGGVALTCAFTLNLTLLLGRFSGSRIHLSRIVSSRFALRVGSRSLRCGLLCCRHRSFGRVFLLGLLSASHRSASHQQQSCHRYNRLFHLF